MNTLRLDAPTPVFPHAAATGAISHLAAQWYVPVFAGPPLVVCHVACFLLLARGDRR